ncbi:MAG: Hpt domain-containing protein [Bacilli bacterium]|nr:Hpt domain-containing protein [Bacilli bacterium]MBR3675207.1 Hpt domain-containing protein [Bacilli bacterium]MBR6866492.1 Hpt domain-containing protein [Bacilli bacterium]
MNVKEFYSQIGGDYDRAIQMLMNDAFILKLLKKFSEGNYYDELKKARDENDIPHIFAITHTLKGVAGNLCLTPVFEKASAICEATRNKKDGVDVSKEMDDLIETTSAVIKKIEEL